MHCGTHTIETEHLILRQFLYTDADAMLEYWISDSAVQSMYSEPVYQTKAEVEELLDKWIGSYQKEDYYRWAVIHKESGKSIGQIAFFLIDNKNHFGEIEYCISRLFQRKGYCTEAVKAILKYGFSNINFHKIQVCHKENNLASKGVIQKCGFIYEGTLRDFFYTDGKYINRLYYSMLKSEWKTSLYDDSRINK